MIFNLYSRASSSICWRAEPLSLAIATSSRTEPNDSCSMPMPLGIDAPSDRVDMRLSAGVAFFARRGAWASSCANSSCAEPTSPTPASSSSASTSPPSANILGAMPGAYTALPKRSYLTPAFSMPPSMRGVKLGLVPRPCMAKRSRAVPTPACPPNIGV